MKTLIKKIIFIIAFIFIGIFISEETIAKASYDFNFQFDVNEETGEAKGIIIDSPYDTKINTTTGETTVDVMDDSVNKGKVWNMFLEKYKNLIVGFTGFVAITLIAIGMFAFTKLAAPGQSNPEKRHDAIMHIVIIFIAAALLGSASLIFGFSYNVFR